MTDPLYRILIGFWRSHEVMQLPDPAWFVDHEWDAEIRARVIAYVREAPVMPWAYGGYSWCRICQQGLPGSDVSDGVYFWPQGFLHYLEAHDLRPPDAFVQHILAGASPAHDLSVYKPPGSFPSFDGQWWQEQKGWNQEAESHIFRQPWCFMRFTRFQERSLAKQLYRLEEAVQDINSPVGRQACITGFRDTGTGYLWGALYKFEAVQKRLAAWGIDLQFRTPEIHEYEAMKKRQHHSEVTQADYDGDTFSGHAP